MTRSRCWRCDVSNGTGSNLAGWKMKHTFVLLLLMIAASVALVWTDRLSGETLAAIWLGLVGVISGTWGLAAVNGRRGNGSGS